MADQRRVGHAVRRRMGASASHLGQAGGPGGIWHPPTGDLAGAEATARGIAEVPIAGGRAMNGGSGDYAIHGVPPDYPTPTGAGERRPPLARDNAAFVSGVSAGVIAEPHPPRSRLSAGESAGARLTVSPSMKVPQESPVPTQGGGRPVPSSPGRQASFGMGQQGAYGG